MTAKETVENVISGTDKRKMDAFKIKSKAAINGSLFGAGFGYLFSNYKNTNLYATVLIGALIGGLVGNILTIEKTKEI